MEQMRERVARAICSISDPVDSSNWRLYLDEADAALSLMQPEIDRRVAEEKARLLERLEPVIDEYKLWRCGEADGPMETMHALVGWLEPMFAQYEKGQQP